MLSVDRFSGEGAEEEIGTRIEHMFIGFVTVPHFSPLGEGIGFGIPAANPGATIGFGLSEHESIRTVEEIGSFTGPALVLVRYCAGFWFC